MYDTISPQQATTDEQAPPDNSGRWHATIELGYARRGPRTHLVHRRRQGPLAIQRSFHPEGPVCHNYLLHPPGGIVGGDRLDVSVDVTPGAHALITAPGAAKFYRSVGPLAEVSQLLRVASGGTLEWLPLENILFPGARVRQDTRIDLEANARFIGWELHCLGRPTIAERFDSGSADLRSSLWRQDRPLLIERLRVDGVGSLAGAASLRGHPVSGTLLATGANRGHLGLAQQNLGGADDTAVTLLDDLLVARYLGNDTRQAWQRLRSLWLTLRPAVLGVPGCPPRIWAT